MSYMCSFIGVRCISGETIFDSTGQYFFKLTYTEAGYVVKLIEGG